MLVAHITVCIAPESDHSARTTPTTIMITPPPWVWVVRVSVCPSSVTALFGITEERWRMMVSTAPGPANTLNAPSATSSADGIARNAL